ncbi:MAG: aminotransferase class V-fold PLP-dependent enzyme, partial [Methylococcales bacterium]|nr:aminotransferase class V-fold PLP-dependent enzyme [Methylococcales bacterium]
MVYFDHNATTALDERVLEVMQPFLRHCYGNASSLHKMGRIARSAIDVAREQVAALVQVEPKHVIFTSGGTEANNLALQPINKNPQYALSA